jgi:hypothetical protein
VWLLESLPNANKQFRENVKEKLFFILLRIRRKLPKRHFSSFSSFLGEASGNDRP